MAQDGVVRAAGGVVSRRNEGGEAEVLLVRRPHRGDWSFPKGKVELGIPAAANLLSYPGDRQLLAAFAAR